MNCAYIPELCAKLKSYFIKFWSSPRCVFWLGMAITLLATSLEVFRGRNTNYFDYQDSTRMFWEGISPYNMEYAQAHNIYFLYTPVFSVIFAPIFLLPWWLGPYVWNVCNYSLFSLAIKTLPEQYNKYKHWIFLFLLPVVLQSVFCYQHNLIVCYIYIFAYSLLERGKGFWAVLLIMISACTKIYGAAELAMLLCYPKTIRNIGYAVLCGVTLLCLPLLNTNFDNPFILYEHMFDMIASHHSDTDFVGILFARGLKSQLLPNYRIVQLIVFALLGIAFFARYKRWKEFVFRGQVLAVLTGFMIMFSDCPETHTYVIALPFYAMAFWMQQKRTWLDWTLFWLLVVNFGILPTDVLCPAWIHNYIHETYWLDVYTFFCCWLLIIWRAVGPDRLTGRAIVSSTAVIVLLLTPSLALNSQAQTKRPTTRVYIVKGITFKMKYVQGGTFTMGALTKDKNADDDEVRHKVLINSYYIGETEVTQELWEAVMGKNRSKQKGAKFPVEYITYDMCKEFISKLNALTHSNFRLPSEAEWEYAARGGRKSKGYLFAGSDNPDEVAHTIHNTKNNAHSEVATLKPNELGLYDMSGNVWEWCEDWYRKSPTTQPSSSFHVIKGGGYDCSPLYCRSTNRFMYDQRRRRPAVGFRLCQTIIRNQ